MTHPFRAEFDKAMAEYQPLQSSEVADLWNASGQNVTRFSRAIEQRCRQPKQIPWPTNATEVRSFLHANVAVERYAREDCQPDGDDTYTMSANDFLGAIVWWREMFDVPNRDPQPEQSSTFKIGDRVRKVSGSQWKGIVVGTYSTELTPEGYAVESSTEQGSVQIYPAKALEIWDDEPVSAAYQLPQPQQEPVAWLIPGTVTQDRELAEANGTSAVPLYTNPPQRQPLTAEEVDHAFASVIFRKGPAQAWFEAGVRFAEAAHGIAGEK